MTEPQTDLPVRGDAATVTQQVSFVITGTAAERQAVLDRVTELLHAEPAVSAVVGGHTTEEAP